MALSAEDGIKIMFKFPESAIPRSLGGVTFEQYDIVGIAQYGASGHLSPETLANLKRTGSCFKPDVGTNCQTMQCTSGGEGASQCSAGSNGCSVTCQAGHNACCNANTNQCCCQKEQSQD